MTASYERLAADPEGLRQAAASLGSAAEEMERAHGRVKGAAGDAMTAWQSTASLSFLAATHRLDAHGKVGADALRDAAAATNRFASMVDHLNGRVDRLNYESASAATTPTSPPPATPGGDVHDRHYAAVVEDYHVGAQQYSQDLDDLNRRFKELMEHWGPAVTIPKKGWGLFQHGKSYFSWWRNALGAFRELGPAAALEPAAMARLMLRASAADAAMDAFRTGAKGAGFLGRFLSEGGAARLAAAKGVFGRIFLPATVLSGLVDLGTGGGYHGWRGVTTRVMGGVGAGGAAALLLVGAATLGPVGFAIAGGAVLAYGAWSLGNLAWDHRQAIVNGAKAVGNTVVEGGKAVVHGIADGAKSVTSVITHPSRLIPHIGGVF